MFDIIIKNGTVIDGTGVQKYRADVGIKGEEIFAIGNLQNEKADLVVDAAGLFVAPGFIDVNNHSDVYWRLFLDPDLESLLYQGVTTIIGGNCGASLAPLANRDSIKSIQKYANLSDVTFNWLSMAKYLEELERKTLALNFGTLVGHTTLRRGLVGDETRDVNPNELATMKKMLADALHQGALGFSTGLVYTHAKLASELEIMELAQVVQKYDGVYTTHIRSEGKELLRSVEEAIRISHDTGVSMQISHLKAMGRKNWPLMEEALNLIETARTNGIDVNFDVYPYTVTGSVLYIFLPDWVAEGGRQMLLSRLKDPDIRQRVLSEMRQSDIDYASIVISISGVDKSLNRRTINELAKARSKSAEETVLDVLVASEGRVVTMMDILSDQNVDKAVVNPFSMIASNGSGYNLEHRATGELVHPRSFGAFPRALNKYVRERGVFGWEEAVRKMSALPAQKFHLEKRGTLQRGNFADVVVFDPEKIQDLATVENPYQYSAGVEWLLVNGEVVIKDKLHTKNRPGKILRRKKKFLEF